MRITLLLLAMATPAAALPIKAPRLPNLPIATPAEVPQPDAHCTDGCPA